MENWSKLKADEKIRVIKFARLNGVSDINTIRDTYNIYSSGGDLSHKKSGEELGESSILQTSVPSYLAAQKQPYVEPKPVDSFLGTDYVHNFIQKNKDAMLPGGDWSVNSPAHRIDLAYMRQADKGSYILGVNYLDLVNKLHGKNASSGEYFQSFSTVTPKYFPNKTSYQYLYNTPEMSGHYYKSYLPSMGWHEYAYSTGGPLYPFSFEKNPFLKTPAVRYDEGGQTYTVKKGDTFSLIALNVGVSILDLQKLNPTITNVNRIREGLSINIPTYMFSEIFNTPQSTGLSTPQVLRTQPLQQHTPILNVEAPKQKGLKTAGPLDLQELAVRQAYTESRLRPDIVNSKGAYGLFQIMLPALDDYNRINKTNYTLEDMKNADNNIKVRNWYMNYLSNLGFINKGDIQSDSVEMYKVLASFNAGAGNVKNALTKAKADGKDIYDSWDWVSYLWDEPREYADFILRGIETKGTNKNDSVYKAVSTAKSGTANKIRSSIKL